MHEMIIVSCTSNCNIYNQCTVTLKIMNGCLEYNSALWIKGKNKYEIWVLNDYEDTYKNE